MARGFTEEGLRFQNRPAFAGCYIRLQGKRNERMVDAKNYFDELRPAQANPGLPRDFYPGEVTTGEHLEYYNKPKVVELLLSDDMPIPAAAVRENYYGDRHIEYWISGYVDACKMEPFCSGGKGRTRYLDFGGATGRVSRHMTRDPTREVWLCDININWIAWVDKFFNRPIHAFQNKFLPPLPIEDDYFDLISGFSVFTHLDKSEIPWLLELRRLLKPGGYLYLTVLDENVWDRLKDPNWDWLFKSISRGWNDDFLAERCKAPLSKRIVLQYSSAEAYNINTFLPRAYLEKEWGALFSEIRFMNDYHNFQTVVVLRKP
jgi:SAM-dependent methyltransferase